MLRIWQPWCPDRAIGRKQPDGWQTELLVWTLQQQVYMHSAEMVRE